MGKGEGEEFGGRQGRDPGKEPGLAVGRAGPALSVFSETVSGCSMSLGPPLGSRVPAGSCLEGGGCSRHLRAPGDRRTLKTGDPVPVLLPRGTLGHSFYSSSSLRVHVKDAYLTCDPWQVSALLGLSFPICAGLP